MRNLLMALLVVGLLAAPSLGVVNIKLTADSTSLLNGQSTIVHVLAQGTGSGLFSLGGYIVPTSVSGDADVLTSTSGSMVFDPLFNPTGLFTPKSYYGTVNSLKGGWGDATPANSGFGTQQTSWSSPDPLLGKAGYVEVAKYTVVADAAVTGVVSLGMIGTKTVGGYKPLETDTTGVLGTLTPVVISVTPEPVTMALLAIGGLMMARRRR
jgi:hypothetical protein